MKTPVLRTERLVLDALGALDEDAVFESCQDPEVQRYTTVPVPYTREHAQSFVGDVARDTEEADDLVLWAIRLAGGAADARAAASGAPTDALPEPASVPLVGVIDLRLEPIGSATVGFWLAAPFRGRGLMTEALHAVAGWALDGELALQRLHWAAAVGNVGSATVARRAGFHFEGVQRRSLVQRDDRIDSWQASLLAEDSRDQVDGWPL